MNLINIPPSNFIRHFKLAALSEKKRYVCLNGETSYGYSATKNPTFKVDQIAALAKESADYYSAADCKTTLEERVALLKDLKTSLTICAQRIEESIKRRWWYWILHFFGYQAKCPKSFISIIKTLDENIPVIEEEIKKKIPPPDPMPTLPKVKRNPFPVQRRKKIAAPSPLPVKVIPTTPCDFEKLHDNLKREVFKYLPLGEVVNFAGLTKGLTKSVHKHIHHFKTICKEIMDIVLEKPKIKSKRCIYLVNEILQEPTIKDFFRDENNLKFKQHFFNLINRMAKDPLFSCDSFENRKILINLFFEHSSEAQLKSFLLNILHSGAFTNAKEIRLISPNTAKDLLDTLVSNNIKKILDFKDKQLVESFLICLVKLNSSSDKNSLDLFHLFYHSFPNLDILKKIKSTPFKCTMFVNDSLKLFESLEKDLTNDNLNNEIAKYRTIFDTLKLFVPRNLKSVLENLFYFFGNDEAKLILITRVFLLGNDFTYQAIKKLYVEFILYMMNHQNPLFSSIALKEYFRVVEIKETPAWIYDLLSHIKTKSELKQFFNMCKAYKQPEGNIFLKCAIDFCLRRNGFQRNVEGVLTELQIDKSAIDLTGPVRHAIYNRIYFFNELLVMAKEEQLVQFLEMNVAKLEKDQRELQILAAGCLASSGEVIKTKLGSEKIELLKQVFMARGYDFNELSKTPLSIQESFS